MSLGSLKKRGIQFALTIGICGLASSVDFNESHAAVKVDERAVIRIDSMSVAGFTIKPQILMYAEGTATVEFNSGGRRLLADTIRLSSAPTYSLDVSRGSVHLEMIGGESYGGGAMLLSGFIDDPQGHHRVRGVGRHLIVEMGGTGIRVIDRGNPRLLR